MQISVTTAAKNVCDAKIGPEETEIQMQNSNTKCCGCFRMHDNEPLEEKWWHRQVAQHESQIYTNATKQFIINKGHHAFLILCALIVLCQH